MKRSVIAILIALLCCFGACSVEETSSGAQNSYNSQDSMEIEDSQSTQDSPIPENPEENEDSLQITTPYSAENLKTVFFTDTEKALTVDVSKNTHLQTLLLGVKYYKPEAIEAPQPAQIEVKYTLSLQGMDLQIGADGVVCFLFEDGTKQNAVVLQNEFAYLETLIEGNVFSFNGYTTGQTVQVFNSGNAEGTIADKQAFLDALKGMRFVKLNNKEHYQIGSKGYTIRIDEEEIAVYKKHVVFNGDLYVVYEGDFDFLKDIKFDASSGWLPWL